MVRHSVYNLIAVENTFFRNLKLKDDLAEWGAANNSTRRVLDDLLKILIDYGLDLPKDSRTLKRTPRDINTFGKCHGELIYLVLKKALYKSLEKIDGNEDNLTSANNIDGIPLSKLSSVHL